jgi:tetratricopeptide (TPR) repeat protein
MDRTYNELLDDYSAATRRGDEIVAKQLERILLDRSGDASLFIVRSAVLEAEAGRNAHSATKWAAAGVLRPEDYNILRQELNARTKQGDIDIALRHIRSSAPLDHGFVHFYWALHKLTQFSEWETAAGLVNTARNLGHFSETEMAAAEALVQLEGGLDLTAEAQVRKFSKDKSIGGQHCRRLQAELLTRRGEHDTAAEIFEELALTNGSFGDLMGAVGLHEMLLHYDAALNAIERVCAHWPVLAPGVEPTTKRIDDMRARAEQALSEHGPLRPFDTHRILDWLRGGCSAGEVLWARQALMAMAEAGELPVHRAAEFLRPFGAWEDSQVNRFLGRCYLRQAPEDPMLLHYQMKVMAQDPTLREGLMQILLRIAPEAMNEEILAYAILCLRERDHAPPQVASALAAPAEVLRSRIAEALPRTTANFRSFASAQLAKLGLDITALDTRHDDEAIRRAVHRGSLFGRSPWTLGTPRRAVHARRPVASVVVAQSGQMRGFERAWPTVHEYLVHPLRAPVAISLWDTSQNAIGRHAKRLERTLPPDLLALIPPLERFTDVFQEKFPRSAEMLFGKVAVDPGRIESLLQHARVQEYFVETESESTYDRTLIPNPNLATHGLLKMFAKFYRLEQIIASMESERGETFTHVCWLRPDSRINRFSRNELDRWLEDFDEGSGHSVRLHMVLDYMLFLPRRVFGVLAKIFPAAIQTDDIEFLSWRPLPFHQLSRDKNVVWPLGGPETIAAALFASGITLHEIRCMAIELMGYMPPEEALRQRFMEEYEKGRD